MEAAHFRILSEFDGVKQVNADLTVALFRQLGQGSGVYPQAAELLLQFRPETILLLSSRADHGCSRRSDFIKKNKKPKRCPNQDKVWIS